MRRLLLPSHGSRNVISVKKKIAGKQVQSFAMRSRLGTQKRFVVARRCIVSRSCYGLRWENQSTEGTSIRRPTLGSLVSFSSFPKLTNVMQRNNKRFNRWLRVVAFNLQRGLTKAKLVGARSLISTFPNVITFKLSVCIILDALVEI